MPDDNGLVRWWVRLPPHGHEKVELAYAVKRRKDVAFV